MVSGHRVFHGRGDGDYAEAAQTRGTLHSESRGPRIMGDCAIDLMMVDIVSRVDIVSSRGR